MKPVNLDLIGYLLDALDPEERRAVAAHLRADPAARDELERLRRSLAPLEADRDTVEPPPGLVARALARVDEYRSRTLPLPPRTRGGFAAAGWWRRSDVLVAGVLLLLVLGVAGSWLFSVRERSDVADCQNNLRRLHAALMAYSDQRGDDALPMVDEKGPRSVACIFIPTLSDAGVLGQDVSVACPTTGGQPPPREKNQVHRLNEWYHHEREKYNQAVRQMAGCYAYTLGYRDGDRLRGLRRPGNDTVPILADRPPFRDPAAAPAGNSLNHGGRGQNVLFIGGTVRFVTTRAVSDDDIYLNHNQRVLAGVHVGDFVLGPGDSSP